MNIQEEVRINLLQPCVMADSEIGAILTAIVENMSERGYSTHRNIYVLMSAAYNAGVVQGKRVERRRRKKRIEKWEG